MSRLNYPAQNYEIIVATDQKEVLARDKERGKVVDGTLQFISKGLQRQRQLPTPEQRELAIGLLGRMALEEYRSSDFNDPSWPVPLELARSEDWLCSDIVHAIVQHIIEARGRLHIGRVYCLLRRAFPECTDQDIGRLYPNYLCLALPIVAAYSTLCGDQNKRLLRSVIRSTAQANHRVTQDLIHGFAQLMTNKVLTRLRSTQERGQIESHCRELYASCFPTTQSVVKQLIKDNPADAPRISLVDVPYDFDGLYPGECIGTTVASTKGRALNYALSSVSEATDICGFYDAESRPNPDVLLYVAYKHLTSKERVRIWQGPVFQVRNFYEMGPFSKIASLYQAVAHDWYLPVVFRRLPFVGGTNLFVETKLLKDLGGYDNTSLTEDLELGTRAYLATGAWPDYLPYASSEQTPPFFTSFYRQRLRWGTGHLQVMAKIRAQQGLPPARKRRLMRELSIKGPLEWVFYQSITLLPPTLLILYWTGRVDSSVVPPAVRIGLNVLSLVYISFTFYAFYRYYNHLDRTSRPLSLLGNIGVGAQLFFLPLAAFFFPVPYTSAMVLKLLNRHPTTWTKTPRTRE
jgi:cellulose synthase/poly-beta-1,6-N-acetylglucosamine synthase-like glycosyltransferase